MCNTTDVQTKTETIGDKSAATEVGLVLKVVCSRDHSESENENQRIGLKNVALRLLHNNNDDAEVGPCGWLRKAMTQATITTPAPDCSRETNNTPNFDTRNRSEPSPSTTQEQSSKEKTTLAAARANSRHKTRTRTTRSGNTNCTKADNNKEETRTP